MPGKKTPYSRALVLSKKAIHSLESKPVSLPLLLAWTSFIGFSRIVLEMWVFAEHPFLSVQMVVYHVSWFASVTLALSILLHFLANTRVLKTTRLVYYCIPVILLSVLLDGLVFGQKIAYSYVSGAPTHILKSFVSLLLAVPYLAPGFKIEILLILLGVLGYLYIKRRNVLPALGGLVLVYAVLFFFGTDFLALASPLFAWQPFLEKAFYFLFDSNQGAFAYQASGYMGIFSILLFAWLYLYSKKKFLALLKNVRLERILIFFLAVAGGFLLAKGTFLFDLGVALAAIFFAWNYGVAVNDLSDIEIDRKTNKHRPLVKGVLSREEMTNVAILSGLLSAGFAFSLGIESFYLILLALGSTTFYSLKPFRLKRLPMSSFFSALGVFIGLLLGYNASFPQALNPFVLRLSIAALVLCTLGFNVKDIKDYKGDKTQKIMTLPVLFGEKKGKQAIALLVLLSYLAFPLIIGIPFLLALSLLFGAVSYPLITRKRFSEKPVIFLYLLYVALLGILFLLLGPSSVPGLGC